MFEEEFASSEWIERVKEYLKSIGARFEAEESVRIHRNDVVIEAMEKGDKFSVVISIEIPTKLSLEEVDRYSKAYKEFLEIIAKSSAQPLYELDTSTGYAFLRASIDVENVDSLIELLKKIMK